MSSRRAPATSLSTILRLALAQQLGTALKWVVPDSGRAGPRSIRRRMPPRRHPDPSRVHHDGSVQAKRIDGRPSDRGPADDPSPGVPPGKMFLPDLLARIEQPNTSTALRVQRRDAGALGKIAGPAGQPQVSDLRRSAQRLRDQMLDRQGHAGDGLRAEAVATPVTGILGHTALKLFGNIDGAHLSRREEMSWPRSFRRRAA